MAFLLENNCVEQDDMKKNVSYWAEKVGMIETLNRRPQDCLEVKNNAFH